MNSKPCNGEGGGGGGGWKRRSVTFSEVHFIFDEGGKEAASNFTTHCSTQDG